MLFLDGRVLGCGVAVISGNRILLGERTDGQGWALAGGKLEKGETPEQAALRELKEEFNIDAINLKFVTQIYSEAFIHGPKYDVTSYIYVTGDFNGTPKPQEGEMSSLKWFPLKDLDMDILFPPSRISIPAIKEYLEANTPPNKKYTADNATECPRYRNSHWDGCGFSPEAEEAIKKNWTMCVCHACLLDPFQGGAEK